MGFLSTKLFIFVHLISLSLTQNGCTTRTSTKCGYFTIFTSCPDNSECESSDWCRCKGSRLWINNRCRTCDSFQECQDDECVYKQGKCDECPRDRMECYNGECVFTYPYCNSNSGCHEGEFCQTNANTFSSYGEAGECVPCPNMQDTFCSTMGMQYDYGWENDDITRCYDSCGYGDNTPECECLQSWREPEDACVDTQYGCPAQNCFTGGDDYRWCNVNAHACGSDRYGGSQNGGAYMFCDDNTPTSGCREWGNCINGYFCNMIGVDYTGAQFGECITCSEINNDCYSADLPDYGPETGLQHCLHTCNQCTISNPTCAEERHFCSFDDWGVTRPGFCETCEHISNCAQLDEPNSLMRCENTCECMHEDDCTGETFCDWFSEEPNLLGICHNCPDTMEGCLTRGLIRAQRECEMECFPCVQNGDCDDDFFCNFDRTIPDAHSYGFCEDCESIDDCTAAGLNALGEQDCKEICGKYPTDLPTASPSTDEPTRRPSASPSVNCEAILNVNSCRFASCAWLANENRCVFECEKKYNLNTVGDSLLTLNSGTLDECEIECLETDLCKRYTYEEANGQCTLYSDYTHEEDQSGIITGQCFATFEPTPLPTISPSVSPSTQPSTSPSNSPSLFPSNSPTAFPSKQPTNDPTNNPTNIPTLFPTYLPSANPTADPTFLPTCGPTALPTVDPTVNPTYFPTVDPTVNPTYFPTVNPTFNPTIDPSMHPSFDPTSDPSQDPSVDPSTDPTMDPSVCPSLTPTLNPTIDPTMKPSVCPSLTPTLSTPSTSPSTSPTSNVPTGTPTDTNVVEATIEFNGVYDQIIGDNKEQFLQECNDALPDVECRDVAPGSIILTIRGEQDAVDQAVQNIMASGLSLPGFTIFTVTSAFAAQNATPEESDEQWYETNTLYIVIGGSVLVCCICWAVFYSFCGEKYVEVIDLATVHGVDPLASDDDLLANGDTLPEEGGDGTPGMIEGDNFIEMGNMTTPQGSTPGESFWPGSPLDALIDPNSPEKRTPGGSAANFGGEGCNDSASKRSGVSGIGMEKDPSPVSLLKKQTIEEGLFGKLSTQEVERNVAEGIISGGSRLSVDPPSGDEDLGLEDELYSAEGNGRAPTGSQQYGHKRMSEGLPSTQKSKLGEQRRDEGTRISLSLSDDSEPPNVQALYDSNKRTPEPKGKDILPSIPSSSHVNEDRLDDLGFGNTPTLPPEVNNLEEEPDDVIKPPDNILPPKATVFETNKSLHL